MLEKKKIIDKIETIYTGHVQVRVKTVILEEDKEISKSFSRYVLSPARKTGGAWVDTDLSEQPEEVKAICLAFWTEELKQRYKEERDKPHALMPG